MRFVSVVFPALAMLAVTGGCATSSDPSEPATVLPAVAADPPIPGVGMSLREATALVQAFEARQTTAARRLPAPTTMEGAIAALKSDRLDAFSDAVAWLSGQSSVEARALRAQLFLAWGEAELCVAELLGEMAARVESRMRAVQVRSSDAKQSAELEAERARIDLYRRTDEALRILAAEHVAAGAGEAQGIIAAAPDAYVGYRIAADGHRLRSEWKEFSEMVLAVEERNPDSNGLVFLRGVAAQLRDGDATEAGKMFRQALTNDPQFVRAQAQLVLTQTNIFLQHQELQNLRALSPDHQIVRWAGPGIDEAHREAAARQAAAQHAMDGRPTGPSNPLGTK